MNEASETVLNGREETSDSRLVTHTRSLSLSVPSLVLLSIPSTVFISLMMDCSRLHTSSRGHRYKKNLFSFYIIIIKNMCSREYDASHSS